MAFRRRRPQFRERIGAGSPASRGCRIRRGAWLRGPRRRSQGALPNLHSVRRGIRPSLLRSAPEPRAGRRAPGEAPDRRCPLWTFPQPQTCRRRAFLRRRHVWGTVAAFRRRVARGPFPARHPCRLFRRPSAALSAWRTEIPRNTAVFLAPIRMPPTQPQSGGHATANRNTCPRADGRICRGSAPSTEFAGDPAAVPGAPPAPAPSRRPGVTPPATRAAADSCRAGTPSRGGLTIFPCVRIGCDITNS